MLQAVTSNAESEIDEVELREQRLTTEYCNQYDAIMPIETEYDPALCRDEYLRQLFEELNLPEISEVISSSSTSITPILPIVSSTNLFIEEKAFMAYKPKVKSKRHLKLGSPIAEKSISYDIFTLTGRSDKYDRLLDSMQLSTLLLMSSRIITRLRIIQNSSMHRADISLQHLPHKLFHWSIDGILSRCELPDLVYLDVLQKDYNSDILDLIKFSLDVLEIIRYYKDFFADTFRNKGYLNMINILYEEQQLLNIGAQLDDDLKNSLQSFGNIDKHFRKIADSWWGEFKYRMVHRCQMRAVEASVQLPIKWRYVRDSYATIVEMQIIKNNIPIEELENGIKQLKENITRNKQSSDSVMYAYNVIIERYQTRINYFSTKLSVELENLEFEIILATNRFHKIQEDYNETQEKMAFMRQRIKEVLDQIESDKQAETRLSQSNKSDVTMQRGSVYNRKQSISMPAGKPKASEKSKKSTKRKRHAGTKATKKTVRNQ